MVTSIEGAGLIDTNVLLYAADEASPLHAASLAIRDKGTTGKISLFLTSQILWEYFAVITNPKRVAVPRSPEEAWTEIEYLQAVFPVVDPPRDLINTMRALAKSVPIHGAQVFDLAIGVTALAAGINIIYSYDETVFSRLPGIVVREP